ncbi:hypothetical protein [Streptomyces sp. PT12]|uniref:hypothetical protein n=1 Tax=Streptomyces sp. PT12 TaxID=1510197 RepID=UPI00215D215F|nr:hypothetical protein [Streptomyces sp. PT12]
MLEAVSYGPPAGGADGTAEGGEAAEAEAETLRGLRHDGSAPILAETLDYFDFLDRLAPGVRDLKKAGYGTWAHPWLNLLLPGDRAAELSRTLLDEIAGQHVFTG